MTSRAPAAGPALALLLVLAGCATPQGRVVLLPDPDGRQTAVQVSQDGREALLQQPYAGAQLTRRGPQPYASSAQEVQARFGAALAAQPLPPADFTLYFVEGKDEFTDASKQVIDGVFAEIARRPVPDVLVIGHTDTVGNDAFNDTLSRQRAEVVRKALIERGIAADKVAAIGRGKREPVVPTGDGVAEPRNRRVEIQVR
ncbi:MAG: OmpA family protein [Rubrivivax sp.]|nr:OmpA family protein [Rubrivivax sp.]MDH5338166.1 OmpA family protein [Rubrivivax sp.]